MCMYSCTCTCTCTCTHVYLCTAPPQTRSFSPHLPHEISHEADADRCGSRCGFGVQAAARARHPWPPCSHGQCRPRSAADGSRGSSALALQVWRQQLLVQRFHGQDENGHGARATLERDSARACFVDVAGASSCILSGPGPRTCHATTPWRRSPPS